MKPNFFIIGAPKSGTTALYQYLSSHPNIYMCTPKEPHYFSNDLNGVAFVKTLDEYQNLFKGKNKNHKIIGEASVWYLYSENALANIYNYNKEAKIIVMLRNPIDLFSSLHQYFLFSGYEDKEDLKEAWDSQANRRLGNDIPQHCPDPKFLQYERVLNFGDQVEKLCLIFPQNQIKFILFDDFTAHTLNTYQSILSFLNLQYDNRTNFPIINRSKESRIKILNRYLLSPPKNVKKIWGLSKKIFGNNIIKLANKLILINSKKITHKDKINLDFKKELKKQIKPNVDKLSDIINRDLSQWLE